MREPWHEIREQPIGENGRSTFSPARPIDAARVISDRLVFGIESGLTATAPLSVVREDDEISSKLSLEKC